MEQFIRYNSQVVSAKWSEESSTWTVQVKNGPAYESEVLVNAGGILNNPQLPNIKGLEGFRGPLLHTAAWDSSVNLHGKRVAIIGSGASAIQLLPQIQPQCSKINIFIRTPSWISPPIALPDGNKANYNYKTDEKESFRHDSESYLHDRKNLEKQFNEMFHAFFKKAPAQDNLRNKFEARMREIIIDESLQKHLIPSFEAGCRRINPGEQYLVALQEPNVDPVFEPIECISPNGVVSGGKEYDVEILVAATGFNTTFRPRFPIIGRDGVNLQDLWADHPVSYFGTGVSGFPNYFTFLGPNTPISNGSLIGMI